MGPRVIVNVTVKAKADFDPVALSESIRRAVESYIDAEVVVRFVDESKLAVNEEMTAVSREAAGEIGEVGAPED